MENFRLKDVMESDSIKTGPFGSDLKISDYEINGKYKVYTQENIISNNFSIGDKYISEEKYMQLKSCKINNGEILVSTRGTLGVFSLLNDKFFEPGIIHSSVIKFKLKKNKNNKFFLYQLNYLPHIKQYILNNCSVNAIPALYSRDIKEMIIYNPSIHAQEKIANYLDKETTKIDRKIEILDQKFKKLEEYKQSVIFETVTKGLYSNIPMKDSGIEWIGEIPEDWEVKRVKDLLDLKGGGVDKKINENEDLVKLVNFVDVFKKVPLNNSQEYMVVSCPSNKLNNVSLKKNDILITPSSETPKEIGLANIVLEDLDNTVFSYHILRLRTLTKSLNPKYAYYYFNSKFAGFQFEEKALGTTRVTLSRYDIQSNIIFAPPVSEQDKIVDYLNELDLKISKKKKIIKKKIQLLKEYKQAMIYEAVTGKLDIEDNP